MQLSASMPAELMTIKESRRKPKALEPPFSAFRGYIKVFDNPGGISKP